MNRRQQKQQSGGRTLWPFLTASVALNLGAAVWALSLHFLNQGQKDVTTASVPAQTPVSSMALAATAPAPEGRDSQSAPSPAPKLQWKQLESDSYETYISRLRGIGCPDITIRYILVGELKDSYAGKREELERKILRSTDWSPPPGVSRPEYLAAQLRKLDREIEQMVAQLLGAASPDSPAMADGQQQQSQPSPVRYPTVMEEVIFQSSDSSGRLRYVEPGVVEIPQNQLESIREIQENFIQEIGGPNQDVEDPQYEKVWKTAQRKADQVLQARHGWSAYGDLQRAAAQKAYEQQQKAAAGQ
jgi:hypothetical protein